MRLTLFNRVEDGIEKISKGGLGALLYHDQVTDKNLLTEIERIPPQAKDKQWTAKWIVGRLNNLKQTTITHAQLYWVLPEY